MFDYISFYCPTCGSRLFVHTKQKEHKLRIGCLCCRLGWDWDIPNENIVDKNKFMEESLLQYYRWAIMKRFEKEDGELYV